MWNLVTLSCLIFLVLPSFIITEDTSMRDFEWRVSEADLKKQNVSDIYSPKFRTYNHSVEQTWTLNLYPHGRGLDDRDFFSVYLCYQGQSPVKMQFQFYMPNHKSSKHSHGLTSNVFDANSKCWGYAQFIRQNTVLERMNGYFFGDHVKIGVRLQTDPVLLSEEIDSTNGPGKFLYQQLQLKRYTDLTLVAAQSEWAVHRVILASQSSVFDEMLSNSTDEHPPVDSISISDEDCADVESMLEFMYSGSVHDISVAVNDLVVCADNFNITGLKSYCEDQLKRGITCDNAYESLIISYEHELSGVKATVFDFVINNKCLGSITNMKEMSHYPDLLVEINALLLKMIDNNCVNP